MRSTDPAVLNARADAALAQRAYDRILADLATNDRWQCPSCEAVVTEPDWTDSGEVHVLGNDHPDPPDDEFGVCPDCGASSDVSDWQQVVACDACGRVVTPENASEHTDARCVEGETK